MADEQVEFPVALDLPTSDTAIEYFDGFDEVVFSNNLFYYWTPINLNPYRLSATPVGGIFVTGAAGANMTAGMRIYNAAGWGVYRPARPSSTRTVGFNLQTVVPPAFDPSVHLITFLDGLNPQLALVTQSDGTLAVAKLNYPAGTLGQVLLTSTRQTVNNTWMYLEMSVTFSSTDGAIEVRVNDEVWISGTGLDTVNTGNPTCDGVALGLNITLAAVTTLDFDDFYMRNDGNFCGMGTRVYSDFPTGDGSSVQWARAGTNNGANYKQVNENPADNDTTTVKSGLRGETDKYRYGNLPSFVTGTVFGVMNSLVAKTDNPGVVELTPLFTLGSTIYLGAPHTISTPNQWLGIMDIKGIDPSTGQPWTVAGVQAGALGMRRTSD